MSLSITDLARRETHAYHPRAHTLALFERAKGSDRNTAYALILGLDKNLCFSVSDLVFEYSNIK